MVIDFSKIDFKERPTLVLRNLDGTAIQTLGRAFNIKGELYYNEVSKITFDIPAFADGIETPHYNDIVGTRIVDVLGIGQFVLMNPKTVGDGIKEIKSCTAYSLEYELTYKKITIEEGTYNFFNPVTPDDTIVGIILSYLPSWSIGNVDDSLVGKYRTFSVSGEKIYDFIKSTVQKTYGCIFDFDTDKRQINIRAVSNEAIKSPVYISYKNLAKEIEVEEDTENILTVLDVYGADGVDTRSVNPMGTNKIYNLDYYMNTTNFSQDIIDRWNEWKESYNNYQPQYYNLTIQKMLKTSAILTEENRLLELTNVDLAVLENERSNKIEYLASISNKSSDEYNKTQTALNGINDKIKLKNAEISDCKTKIEALKREKDTLTEALVVINKETAFSKLFNEEELKILDRYFKEDTIEDSSFVISEAESYVDSGWANNIKNATFEFYDGNVEEVSIFDPDTGTYSSDKKFYTVNSGTIEGSVEITSEDSNKATISANVIEGTLERQSDGSFVFSGYLGDGKIGDMDFISGCISLTGTCGNVSTDVVIDEKTGKTLKLSFGMGNEDAAYLYFTKNTTEYEKFSVEWDLYEYGCDCLKKLAYPSYSFDVSSANFLSLDEFYEFSQKLSLGKKIYLEMKEDKVLNPILVGVSFDFDDLSSLKLNFGDTYNLSDSSFSLVDLLEQSVSMGKKFDTSRFNYNSFIDSGASTAVREFMNSALDVAKNAILSGSNMAISWDSSGIHCRKWKDNEHTGYEPEEIAIINNSIVFTDNNWQTAKMAIGKVVDENIAKYTETTDSEFDENKVYYYYDENDKYQIWEGNKTNWSNKPRLYEKNATAYGIVAPYIVGTLLAGENLVIESQKKDGGTSVFKVDAEGASLYNASFELHTPAVGTNQGTHIVIDPKLGLGIGYDNIISVDDKGVKRWNNTNAKFWVDTNGGVTIRNSSFILDSTNGANIVLSPTTGISVSKSETDKNGNTKTITTFEVDSDGNVTIKGSLDGCDGTFSGDISGANGTFAGTVYADELVLSSSEDKVMEGDKFKGKYLNLKGLTVSDGTDTTFEVDSDGNVIIKGKLDGCNGTFSGTLQSPKICSSNFSVFPEGSTLTPDSDYPGFNLYDTFAGSEYHFLNICFKDGAVQGEPGIIFSSPGGGKARWDFGQTHFTENVYFKKIVNFEGATVQGLHATFA